MLRCYAHDEIVMPKNVHKPWGGRKSVTSQHFLPVVPQPISFRMLKKWAKCGAWFIFHALNASLLVRHLPAKRRLHSSVRSLNHSWGTIRRLASDRQGRWSFVAALYASCCDG